jgi:hypothetical protein
VKKIDPVDAMRARILGTAAEAALNIGSPEALDLANRVARAVGLGEPFPANADAWLAQARDALTITIKPTMSDARVLSVTLRHVAFAFETPYYNVAYADASRDAVAKAIKKIFQSTHREKWSSADTATAVFRAAYRAIGGAAPVAAKMLRERVSTKQK